MFSAFFGHHLLEQKIITSKQLEELLNTTNDVRLKLGTLAIHAGFMNSTQAHNLHQMQATEDQRFGDLAIEYGYLTQQQLDTLLSQQISEQLLLSQALLDQGIMSLADFQSELHNYKKIYNLSDQQLDNLIHSNIDMVVHSFLIFENSTLSTYYSDYITLFLKNLIRFIDRDICVTRIEKIDQIAFPHLIRQRVIGDTTIFTGIGGHNHPLLTLANRYAHKSFNEMKKSPIKAIGEFLHLQNNLFTDNLSNQSIQVTLEPQAYTPSVTLRPSLSLYHVPIYTTMGTLDLILGQL